MIFFYFLKIIIFNNELNDLLEKNILFRYNNINIYMSLICKNIKLLNKLLLKNLDLKFGECLYEQLMNIN